MGCGLDPEKGTFCCLDCCSASHCACSMARACIDAVLWEKPVEGLDVPRNPAPKLEAWRSAGAGVDDGKRDGKGVEADDDCGKDGDADWASNILPDALSNKDRSDAG